MSKCFRTKEREDTPARFQKSQPLKKLAPARVSTNVQGEVGVGDGLPPEVEVGVGRLELEEPKEMEEIMTGFPPLVGMGVDDGSCGFPGEFATQ